MKKQKQVTSGHNQQYLKIGAIGIIVLTGLGLLYLSFYDIVGQATRGVGQSCPSQGYYLIDEDGQLGFEAIERCVSDSSGGLVRVALAVDENGAATQIAQCGNGFVDIIAGEQCDDGNTASGDGCSTMCITEVAAGESRPSSLCQDGSAEQIYSESMVRCDGGLHSEGFKICSQSAHLCVVTEYAARGGGGAVNPNRAVAHLNWEFQSRMTCGSLTNNVPETSYNPGMDTSLATCVSCTQKESFASSCASVNPSNTGWFTELRALAPQQQFATASMCCS